MILLMSSFSTKKGTLGVEQMPLHLSNGKMSAQRSGLTGESTHNLLVPFFLHGCAYVEGSSLDMYYWCLWRRKRVADSGAAVATSECALSKYLSARATEAQIIQIRQLDAGCRFWARFLVAYIFGNHKSSDCDLAQKLLDAVEDSSSHSLFLSTPECDYSIRWAIKSTQYVNVQEIAIFIFLQ